jgi:hypothetical protein
VQEVCFWSIADGDYSLMLQTLVESFRQVGMQEDFHVFSDREIAGAIVHPIDANFDKSLYAFKFSYLQRFVKELDYRYFIYLDADNYFVRRPPPLLKFMEYSPLHAFFEGDCTAPSLRKEWHCCPLQKYVEMMRECGVLSERIYTVNAGFFIIKKEIIDVVCGLAMDFWRHCMQNGYVVTEEPPLAYAMHMLCRDTEQHLLSRFPNIWCSDWTGHYADRLPDGKEWLFSDYLTYETYPVNPAIVHALKGKKILVEHSHHL